MNAKQSEDLSVLMGFKKIKDNGLPCSWCGGKWGDDMMPWRNDPTLLFCTVSCLLRYYRKHGIKN